MPPIPHFRRHKEGGRFGRGGCLPVTPDLWGTRAPLWSRPSPCGAGLPPSIPPPLLSPEEARHGMRAATREFSQTQLILPSLWP